MEEMRFLVRTESRIEESEKMKNEVYFSLLCDVIPRSWFC